VPPQGGRKHPEQQDIQLDTSNILFICGGTFVGIEDIIARRLGKKTIGFGQEASQRVDLSLGDLLRHVTADDIVEFGLIPEMVGRLPVVSSLAPLELDDLIRVLTEPKNALVRQYQELFGMENAELEFSDGALRAIAKKAMDRDTGARGLRAIVENLMLDVMFDLPDQQPGAKYVVTEDVVNGRQPLVPIVQEPKQMSA
jgi:ATP-dependent Clp protease ATP-binding subunit ClpX